MEIRISRWLAFLLVAAEASAFTCTTATSGRWYPRSQTRRYNMFKDMIDKAFENDGNLSADKGKGQYDAPGEEFIDSSPKEELTETQKKWRETQLTNDVTPAMVSGSTCSMDLFLAGVAEKDPSNDLYAARVNISSRDKETGLSLPPTPSLTITIEFLEDGVCKASESDFTTGENDGEWKLSEDGKILRFSLDTLGYTRTVETKGSIQKIYWTDEEEKSIQTQSSYSIPPGFVYCDIEVMAGRRPGTFAFGDSGVIRLEKSTGLFGVSSKLVPCGRFEIKQAEN
mmetsp:Transcript_97468/g.281236  ORF Transcript_97468/g.281236 Transcript_97468/m.281236 type:complete len:284 (-) Transcript_97468:3-854(-)